MINFTDLGNAERLIERYGKEVRFCHPWGKFLIWDGKRWKIDEDGGIERRAKETVRAMYKFAGTLQDEDSRKALASWALKSESAGRLASMISLAQSEPGVPVLPEALDADPWLFNCLDGAIDIRTGEVRKHDPALLMTKISPFNFDATGKCSKWTGHLALVMDGNGDLISFLQRAWGSCLTGITDDRKLFIEWGSGKNGKSICNDTIAMILGEYAARTPTETLLIKRGESIPNDLARLKGARFVHASESEAGKRLSESLIKDLTGGERIIARFLHQEWFEYRPEFKLWLSTNHKPVIRGSDEGIWDRICLTPFAVRIKEDKQRPRNELLREFQEEAAGILGWLVHGAYEWYHNGLNPPEEVKAAVCSYREEMDILGDFIGEKCIVERTMKTKSSALYESYKEWCEERGEVALSAIAFGREIGSRGCERGRASDGAKAWVGIGLKPSTWQ